MKQQIFKQIDVLAEENLSILRTMKQLRGAF